RPDPRNATQILMRNDPGVERHRYGIGQDPHKIAIARRQPDLAKPIPKPARMAASWARSLSLRKPKRSTSIGQPCARIPRKMALSCS
ncbi:hypothetical protein, partial [Staphylococcus aureus]